MAVKMSEYSDFLYTILIPALGGVVIILNIIEIIFIMKQKKFTMCLVYILNLSVSDVLVGAVMVTLKSMYPFMKTTLKGNVAAKEGYDVLKHVFVRLSLFLSVFHLLAITFDRLLSVSRPYFYRNHGQSFPYKVCAGTWVAALICVTIVYCISRFHLSNVEKYNNLLFPISTYSATIFFAVSYMIIFMSIRRSSQKLT